MSTNTNTNMTNSSITKRDLLPIANNTTEVRHEYLAKVDNYFPSFSLSSLAAAAQFSAHDAAIRNKRKTTENLRSESVRNYPKTV